MPRQDLVFLHATCEVSLHHGYAMPCVQCTAVSYCDFWGNHSGAAALCLCTSTGTWWNTGGRAPWEPGGYPLHVPTRSFHKVTSLKILPKRKTKNILTEWRQGVRKEWFLPWGMSFLWDLCAVSTGQFKAAYQNLKPLNCSWRFLIPTHYTEAWRRH